MVRKIDWCRQTDSQIDRQIDRQTDRQSLFFWIFASKTQCNPFIQL